MNLQKIQNKKKRETRANTIWEKNMESQRWKKERRIKFLTWNGHLIYEYVPGLII